MTRPLAIEQLERRDLLSLTLTISGTETVRLDGAVVTAEEFSYSSEVGPVNVLVNPTPDQLADYTVPEDEVLVVNAANGVSGGLTGVVLVAGPTHGVMVLDDNGEFIYAPDHNYYGPDHFIFSRDDITFLISLSVTAASDPPVVIDDLYHGMEDEGIVTGSVFDNDWDPDGDLLSIDSFTQPANGVVAHDGDGIFTYTPDADWNGTDSFAYVASDGNGGEGTATVTIQVSAVNDAPSAAPDAYTTRAGEGLGVNGADGPLANDFDVDGDALSGVVIVSSPIHGNLTISEDSGAFLYQPDPEYIGGDSFEYKAFDGLLWSEPATVSIDVVASDGPIVRSEVYISGPGGITVDAAGGVLANDSNDSDGLTALMVVFPAHGLMDMAADGSFSYTPHASFVGADPFTYRATAGEEFAEVQSAIWVDAAIGDVPSSVPENQPAGIPDRSALGGGSIYDVAFHQATRRPNWDPVLSPAYVDSFYADQKG